MSRSNKETRKTSTRSILGIITDEENPSISDGTICEEKSLATESSETSNLDNIENENIKGEKIHLIANKKEYCRGKR